MSKLAILNRMERDERGSILVEFALLAPVIILAMIGVFQVRRIFCTSKKTHFY